jgi:hypothetical protein
MRAFRGFVFIFLLLFAASGIQAQEVTEADTVDLGILLRREKAASIMLHTLGYGFGYRMGYNITYYKNTMLEADLFEMKAPNQIRRYNQIQPNPRSYYYGKLNNLYILRLGAGRQHLINRKPYWGGIEVRGFYYGGFSGGFAKPTYLYIDYYEFSDNNLYVLNRQLEKYDPERHFPDLGTNPNELIDIYGRGPFLKGFNKLKFYPGLYLKGGFNFEFSSLNDRIKSLEAGVAADIFIKKIPMMIQQDHYRFFITGYLSFHLGKRYN